jgi:hypothetical protein
MSKTIDKSDLTSLSEEDILYLAQRDQVSEVDLRTLDVDVESVRAALSPDRVPISQMPNTGTAMNLSPEEFELIMARRQEQAEKDNEKEVFKPDGVDAVRTDGEDTFVTLQDEGVAFDDPRWTNDLLRAALADRGLETSGKKAELIERLEADSRP